MNAEGNNGNKPLGLRSVVPIGIGVMVGAGISALLGQVVLLMEAPTWVAFVFDGIVVMFSGCAYTHLGTGYPSNDGIIDFFRRGLDNGVFSLVLSLLYLLMLAVSTTMVARAFGAYAVQFLHEGSLEEHLILLYALRIIAMTTLFSSLSNRAVGRLEAIPVGTKMMIPLLLTTTGVWSLQPAHISVSVPLNSGAFFFCIGIAFLTYADLGMMADAADKVEDLEAIIPRASLVAIGITTLLYISLALVLLSDVSALELEKHADTAVAQVVSPLLGHVRYVVVTIGTLLVTVLTINANLFAMFSIMDNMSSGRKLSKLTNRPLWRQSTWGDIIVMVLIILITVALNLGSLTSVASATFLICYLAVLVMAIRLRHDIHALLPILIVGTLVMLLVIVGSIYSLWSQGSHALIWITSTLLLSLIVVMTVKRSKTIQHLPMCSISCTIVVAVDIRTGKKTCLNIC